MSGEFFEEGFSKFDSAIRSQIFDDLVFPGDDQSGESKKTAENATNLDRVNTLQPCASTAMGPPSSASVPPSPSRLSANTEPTRIEKTLHELDGLIQQRRVELSNMRKNSRHRLSDKSTSTPTSKTPSTAREISESGKSERSRPRPLSIAATRTDQDETLLVTSSDLFKSLQDELQSTKWQWKREAEAKAGELERQQLRIKELEGIVEDLDAQIAQLAQRNRLLTQDVSRLDQESFVLQQRNGELQLSEANLKELLNAKIREVEVLSSEIARLQEELNRKEEEEESEDEEDEEEGDDNESESEANEKGATGDARLSGDAAHTNSDNNNNDAGKLKLGQLKKQRLDQLGNLHEPSPRLSQKKAPLMLDLSTTSPRKRTLSNGGASQTSPRLQEVLQKKLEQSELEIEQLKEQLACARADREFCPVNAGTSNPEAGTNAPSYSDLMAERDELQAKFQSAAQSAFEWEAHASALSAHFERQLADSAAKLTQLSNQVTGMQTHHASNRQYLLALVKRWMEACNMSWTSSDMRRLFDILKLNVILEKTKKMYKQKCDQFVKSEIARLHEEWEIQKQALHGADGGGIEHSGSVEENSQCQTLERETATTAGSSSETLLPPFRNHAQEVAAKSNQTQTTELTKSAEPSLSSKGQLDAANGPPLVGHYSQIRTAAENSGLVVGGKLDTSRAILPMEPLVAVMAEPPSSPHPAAKKESILSGVSKQPATSLIKSTASNAMLPSRQKRSQTSSSWLLQLAYLQSSVWLCVVLLSYLYYYLILEPSRKGSCLDNVRLTF